MPRIQRLHAQPPCATSHKSGLRITAAHGPGTHLVFEMVVIDRHVAVFKEAHERTPVIQAVVDRLSDCTPIGNPFALELKPQVHFSAQRLGASLSHGQPFVGAQSVGQEGLDFHTWCHSVIHWNLPSNPVDLEQREGRVHRYKGHAVRKNLTRIHGSAALASLSQDPWQKMFDLAHANRPDGSNEIFPYWLLPLEGGAC